MRLKFLLNIGFFTLPALFGNNSLFATTPKQPNILFIFADDLGKEWVSSYGAEGIETPNIDRLANTGLSFGNFYSMPQFPLK